MTRQLHPADALELSLAGMVAADAADELLAVVASLRAASGGIMAPTGLRARRGALVARGRPLGALRPSFGRRLQAALMAATFAVVASVSFVGARAGLSWLRDVMPDAPAPYGSPGRSETGDTPSPAPTPSPTPNPLLHGLTEPDAADPADGPDASEIGPGQPVRRLPDEQDDDEDAPDGIDDDEEDFGGEEGDAALGGPADGGSDGDGD